MWHRWETRRQTEKTNLTLKSGEFPAYSNKTGGSRRALFSDEPLPFDRLDAVDADIAFNARNLKARDAALEFGQLALRLDAGDLRVDGSVLNPRVRPDMASVATKGVKALSSLVLGPAGLLVPFMSAGARHQHPCDVAALKNRIHSIYR